MCPLGAKYEANILWGGEVALWAKHRGPEFQSSELRQEFSWEGSLGREVMMTKDLDKLTSKIHIVRREPPIWIMREGCALVQDKNTKMKIVTTLCCRE